MKLTLAGAPGSGKSTLRKTLAEKYHLEIKATGDFMRETARKYGYTDITKFIVEYLSSHPEVDQEIDRGQEQYGRSHNDFVLDAHIGFHFVPDSIKIMLQCDPEVAAQRIFDAHRTTEEAHNPQEAIEANRKRSETMRANFLKLYHVDIHDLSNFDIVLDTTRLTPEEVSKTLIEHIEQIRRTHAN